MTWKSYAAVSGATVLAGWLASSPPANAPVAGASSQRGNAPTGRSAADSDIEEQATRLQHRVRQETTFRDPARNPFRFGARQAARSAPADSVSLPQTVEAFAPALQAPAVSLSGIAEDQIGERMERTAILSTPSDVLLVREGDEVMGQYRVAKIEAGAVELLTLADGTTLRLTLKTTP